MSRPECMDARGRAKQEPEPRAPMVYGVQTGHIGNRTFGHIGNTFSSLTHRIVAFHIAFAHFVQINPADLLMTKVYGVFSVTCCRSECHMFAFKRLTNYDLVILETAGHVLADLSDMITR